jgi:dihydroorotase
MSTTPAAIGRYVEHGKDIAVGNPAHVTVMNPTAAYRVDRDLVASKSRNTPFHGMELPGVVGATFYNGALTYRAGA